MENTELTLSFEKKQFIERLGFYYENYGVPRIGGRILGFLLIAGEPVSAEQITRVLKVSRSSVSTNLRLLLTSGMLEVKPREGERTDYFVMSEDAWRNTLRIRMEGFINLKRLAASGIEAVQKEGQDSPRLGEMLEWSVMMIKAHEELLQKWDKDFPSYK